MWMECDINLNECKHLKSDFTSTHTLYIITVFLLLPKKEFSTIVQISLSCRVVAFGVGEGLLHRHYSSVLSVSNFMLNFLYNIYTWRVSIRICMYIWSAVDNDAIIYSNYIRDRYLNILCKYESSDILASMQYWVIWLWCMYLSGIKPSINVMLIFMLE